MLRIPSEKVKPDPKLNNSKYSLSLGFGAVGYVSFQEGDFDDFWEADFWTKPRVIGDAIGDAEIHCFEPIRSILNE